MIYYFTMRERHTSLVVAVVSGPPDPGLKVSPGARFGPRVWLRWVRNPMWAPTGTWTGFRAGDGGGKGVVLVFSTKRHPQRSKYYNNYSLLLASRVERGALCSLAIRFN